jgi:hypothetical protein
MSTQADSLAPEPAPAAEDITAKAAAAAAAHHAERAAQRDRRTCLQWAWVVFRTGIGALFTAMILMNGVSAPLFSSEPISMYGHDFFRLAICASSRQIVNVVTEPSPNQFAIALQFRKTYSQVCPKQWVVKSQEALGPKSKFILGAGVIFALTAPLFCFYTEAAVPAAVSLLLIRFLLKNATLESGFYSLLSYMGLAAFFWVLKTFNLQLGQ